MFDGYYILKVCLLIHELFIFFVICTYPYFFSPFLLQLLYVDSLNVSSLNLNLPEGRFAVNIWSRADIEAVLAADLQNDGKTFGKLEVISFFCFHVCIADG